MAGSAGEKDEDARLLAACGRVGTSAGLPGGEPVGQGQPKESQAAHLQDFAARQAAARVADAIADLQHDVPPGLAIRRYSCLHGARSKEERSIAGESIPLRAPRLCVRLL